MNTLTSSSHKHSLQAFHLAKGYKGRSVVKDVNFEIHSGEVVGLMGPNGAGKTTSFYMTIGLVMPDEGKVTLNGADITEWPIHKRAQAGIAYLPQEASIFRKMSVTDNILTVLELLPLTEGERRDRLQRLIDDFRLNGISNSKGYALSGGERRRVEVARALALNPAFLLLDEPFAGIDPLAVRDIQEMIRVLKEKGIGVLITDHNVRETLAICDRAYILSGGSILAQGTPQEILENKVARETYLGEGFRV
jgi:lipopolysaccharide export system ATP-binding protein